MSSLIYESSSTFTVPEGVKKIDVFCVGGGGSGANLKGNASSVGDICSANGGDGGNGSGGRGSGGSGGGSIGYYRGGNGGSDGSNGDNATGVDSIGSSTNSTSEGGKGQGTTTRYFGEEDGTLYAGGGGGKGAIFNANGVGGTGGDGGGGNGAGMEYNWQSDRYSVAPTAGQLNTGGGGGGGSRGGGGGYTATKLGVAVNPGDIIPVVVGACSGKGVFTVYTVYGTYVSACCDGGSGICIIRWGK